MVIQIYRLVFAAGIIDLKESDLVGGFAILISAFGHCPRMGSLVLEDSTVEGSTITSEISHS
jgi:hypothetical protein